MTRWRVIMEETETFAFRKNLFLAIVFFTLTPLTLFASVYSLVSLSQPEQSLAQVEPTAPRSTGAKIYASLPDNIPSVDSGVVTADARPEIIKQYLEYYKSPLVPYASYLVQAADKYGVDFRLTTAIAQQESNLCKYSPEGTYNCWGWGIHSRGTLGFASYEEAIDTVTKGIRESYLDMGYVSIEDIMSKYTPHSNGSWAFGVSEFMSELQ